MNNVNIMKDKDKLKLLEKLIQENMYIDDWRPNTPPSVKCSYQEDTSLLELDNLSSIESMYIKSLLDPKIRSKIDESASNIQLTLTCDDCPESYKAFIEDEQVGHLDLKFGKFVVQYPDDDGDYVYETKEIKGYDYFDDYEREYFLNEAKIAIAKRMIECGED